MSCLAQHAGCAQTHLVPSRHSHGALVLLGLPLLEHAVDHLLEGLHALLLVPVDHVDEVHIRGHNVIGLRWVAGSPDLQSQPKLIVAIIVATKPLE